MPNPDPHFVRREARRSRASASAGSSLRALDQRKVAVHLVIKGCERLVQGVGTFGLDTKLGGVLRIDCADNNGDFEILIRENDWTGEIKPGGAFGCDYVVRLSLPEKSASPDALSRP